MITDTRKQILAAAERILRTRGLCNVKARDIAREAGYAGGTLYTYFGHKEDIFLAVLNENLPDFVEAVMGMHAGQRTVRANLEELTFFILRFYERIIPFSASLFADMDLLERHRQELREQHMGPQMSYKLVAAYVRAEQQLGRIGAQVNSTSVATLLMGSCFQYMFFRQFMDENPLAITEETFVQELVQTLAEGLLLQKEDE